MARSFSLHLCFFTALREIFPAVQAKQPSYKASKTYLQHKNQIVDAGLSRGILSMPVRHRGPVSACPEFFCRTSLHAFSK